MVCLYLGLDEAIQALGGASSQRATVVLADVVEYAALSAVAVRVFREGVRLAGEALRRAARTPWARMLVAMWAALVGWNYLTIHTAAPHSPLWWLDLSFGVILMGLSLYLVSLLGRED